MKASEIKVGGVYTAKVSNKLTEVRVLSIDKHSGYGVRKAWISYRCLNLKTHRECSFRSARSFRGEVKEEKEKRRIIEKDSSVPVLRPTPSWNQIGPPSKSEMQIIDETTPVGSSHAAIAHISRLLEIERKKNPTPSITHIEVDALAGTGKTTSIIEGVKEVKGVNPAINPSDQQRAIWDQLKEGRTGTIRISSFSTAITDTLKEKVEGNGLQYRGVEARGIHSLGFQAVNRNFGYQKPNKFQVRELISQKLGGDCRILMGDKRARTILMAGDELVSLCKQTLTDPIPENLDQLSNHYDVEIDSYRADVYQMVADVLEECKKPSGRITFDDMVWLPIVHGLPIQKVETQIVDEAQDLNKMQQQLMYRSGHRIVFVGDPNQAIYGFAGADWKSMSNMRGDLGSCVTLPLTVTRRCSKAVVQEARKIVPDFEAHEDNLEGFIEEAPYPICKGSMGEKREMPWEQTYLPMVKPGDFIICRTNAPLVSQCFRFLKRNMKATILGRKIGEGLISLIDKSRTEDAASLVRWIDEWYQNEVKKEESKRMPSDTKIIALGDKHDCLLAFCEGLRTTAEVRRKVEDIFTDDKTTPGIKLSSIHKAKGLEARKVFFLRPSGGECPHPMARSDWQRQQEMNLLYVGITRAIEGLCFVS